jgi:hypothetical protein
MSRQTTLSDVVAQRTLSESGDTPTEREDTPTTDRDLLDRAQAHAADVAAEHFPSLSVDAIGWEVSHRAKRQASQRTILQRTRSRLRSAGTLVTRRVGAIQFDRSP